MENTKRRGRPNRVIEQPPNRLREYRIQSGYTQKELATLVGVLPQSIANAELYGRSIGQDTWDNLADLFDVDPRILKGKKNPVFA